MSFSLSCSVSSLRIDLHGKIDTPFDRISGHNGKCSIKLPYGVFDSVKWSFNAKLVEELGFPEMTVLHDGAP